MAKIAIVGAGQAGLFLGFGLLEDEHEVTLFSHQTSEEFLNGRLPSGMGIFEDAVKKEAALGLTFWEDVMTRGEGAVLQVLNPDRSVGLHIAPPTPRPHRGVDQRLKNSQWMQELERRLLDINQMTAGRLFDWFERVRLDRKTRRQSVRP
jgi:2-polyprenyl-6-methoxyphenol hydroxylase-like FAD-dependent oxidoreductase